MLDFHEIGLFDWKYNCPHLFELKLSYIQKFDKLVARLKDNKIFGNNFITSKEQISFDKKLLIALHWFGIGEKIHNLAMWAKISYDTVDKITQKVFTAIYSSCLKKIYIH